jgi:hypothetical protein
MNVRRPGHHLLASSMSGVVATLAHDACLAPVDTLKQRLQFSARPYRVPPPLIARGTFRT